MRFFAPLCRLWKCCHPFTWVVMLVVGLGLVIIVVPGEGTQVWDVVFTTDNDWACAQVLATDEACDSDVTIYLHGWPRSAVARTTEAPWPWPFYGNLPPAAPVGKPPRSPYWAAAVSWPFSADHWMVNWSNLLLDLAVTLLILTGIGVGTEFWLRRRGGLWRFRIVDLLVLLTVSAFIASWYQSHLRLQDIELKLETNSPWLFKVSELHSWDEQPVKREYCGPTWLRRLVGNVDCLSGLHHFRQVELFMGREWREELRQVARLQYVEDIEVVGVLPREVVAKLAQLSRLRTLELSVYIDWVYSDSDEFWNSFPASELVQPWDWMSCGIYRSRNSRSIRASYLLKTWSAWPAQCPTWNTCTSKAFRLRRPRWTDCTHNIHACDSVSSTIYDRTLRNYAKMYYASAPGSRRCPL